MSLGNSAMIRLLYFSKAAPTTTVDDLSQILVGTRRKNKERDITGALLAGGKVFLQILEGPEPAVLSLYLQILQDKRHYDVEIMRVTPIIHRLFENWSMAFLEATPMQFEQVVDFKTEHFALEEPEEFLRAMRGMADMLKT